LYNVHTTEAPEPLGPYSQAIVHGDLIFVSGQIPLTKEGKLVSGGIEEQTHQVLRNVQAILTQAGSSLDHILKCTLFIQSVDDFAAINEVYSQYFPSHHPARSTVEVSRLPKDVGIEIEVIATKK
jgi:2-iminobutanoate/2-iminopropanoate deaminase